MKCQVSKDWNKNSGETKSVWEWRHHMERYLEKELKHSKENRPLLPRHMMHHESATGRYCIILLRKSLEISYRLRGENHCTIYNSTKDIYMHCCTGDARTITRILNACLLRCTCIKTTGWSKKTGISTTNIWCLLWCWSTMWIDLQACHKLCRFWQRQSNTNQFTCITKHGMTTPSAW